MDRYELFILVGVFLLIPLLISVGATQAFLDVGEHIVEDFTIELVEHAFIAGLILIAYGIYRFWEGKAGKSQRLGRRRTKRGRAAA